LAESPMATIILDWKSTNKETQNPCYHNLRDAL
jgi:hypothetical protein